MAKRLSQKELNRKLGELNKQTQRDLDRILGKKTKANEVLSRPESRRRKKRFPFGKKIALIFLGVGMLYPLSGVLQNSQILASLGSTTNTIIVTNGENVGRVTNPTVTAVPTVFAAELPAGLEQNVLYWEDEVTRVVWSHGLTAHLSELEKTNIVRHMLTIIAVETRGMYQASSSAGALGLTQVMPNMHYGRIQSCNANWPVNQQLISNAPINSSAASSSDATLQLFLQNPSAQICAGLEVFVGDFYRPGQDVSVLAALAGYNGGNGAKNWINGWLIQVPAEQLSQAYAALQSGDMTHMPQQAAYEQGKKEYIASLSAYYSDPEVRQRKGQEVENYLRRAIQSGGLR